MPRFRPDSEAAAGGPDLVDLDPVRALIARTVAPRHFFVRGATALRWEHAASEDVSWEVFRGRLLDATQTRLRETFEAWNIFHVGAEGLSAEPVLSVKLDAGRRLVHVIRAVHCYAWEGYDAGGNVILSRETRKWVRELVATLDLARFSDLEDELIAALFHAVIGTSRLPLTSVEAPLPAFSLGELAYFHRPAGTAPATSWRDLLTESLHAGLAARERAKLLEVLLRAVEPGEVGDAAELFVRRWTELGYAAGDLAALFRLVFNEVALSPYTAFVARVLGFWEALVQRGVLSEADFADFLGYLLRQSVRHLTAYDLVTFHHRGANYPDALLLDEVLVAYLKLAERSPGLFEGSAGDTAEERRRKRLRRRGVRQGWLLRHWYAGLPVPEAPTSPGENARVLPAAHPRIPEEQIHTPARRTRQLFSGAVVSDRLGPSARRVLGESIRDLREPNELQELGMAVFLDRPLGSGKRPGEPDATVLLSYEAFSPGIAERRLKFLAERLGLLDPREFAEHREALRSAAPDGINPPATRGVERPGVVSLNDVTQAADDFRLLRTTRTAAEEFLAQFDFTALAGRWDLEYLDPARRLLILCAATAGELAVYDGNLQKRMVFGVMLDEGYRSRAGREVPAAGLKVLRVWEPAGGGSFTERDLSAEDLRVPPRGW